MLKKSIFKANWWIKKELVMKMDHYSLCNMFKWVESR